MPGANLFSKVGFPLLVACAAILFGWTQGSAQAPSPEQLEEGARLYAENCAVCHGPNGEGRVGATLAKDWPAIRPDMTVRNVIVNGVSGSPMPAWSEVKGGPLTDAQIDALTAFILSWQTGGYPITGPCSTQRTARCAMARRGRGGLEPPWPRLGRRSARISASSLSSSTA